MEGRSGSRRARRGAPGRLTGAIIALAASCSVGWAADEMSREDKLRWGEMLAADCAACHVLGSEPGARHVGIPRISGVPRRELFKSIGACLVNPANTTMTPFGRELSRREKAGELRPGHGIMMTHAEIDALMTYLESMPRR